MSGILEDLSPKQEKLLAKFRHAVQDVLETRPRYDDDVYLLRWLRARNFDLKKSVAMLGEHIKWRDANNVDTILQDYEPPPVMRKFFPGGVFGQDKDGCPLWFDPLGSLDLKGVLMSVRKEDIIRSKVWVMEDINRIFKEKSQQQGRRITHMVAIFDLKNLGVRHLWKPGVDVCAEIAMTYEKHYPEVMKKAYVINAPRVFPVLYNLLRPFLNEQTQKKIVVCGQNFKEVLLQDIDADQLPVHWGGNCVDADGDPMCSSSIVPGGLVPVSYYGCNNLDDLSSFTQVSVGKRSSLTLDFVIHKVDTAIRWQFKTDGSDIGFGVYRHHGNRHRRKSSSDLEPILVSRRVNSHMVPESGSVECKQSGTYVLCFDNSYSWLKSKKLFYLIDVLEPQDTDLDIPTENNASPETDTTADIWTSFPSTDNNNSFPETETGALSS